MQPEGIPCVRLSRSECVEREVSCLVTLRRVFTRSTSDVPRVFVGGEEDYFDSNARREGGLSSSRKLISRLCLNPSLLFKYDYSGFLAVVSDSTTDPRLCLHVRFSTIGRYIVLRWSLFARDNNFRDTRLNFCQVAPLCDLSAVRDLLCSVKSCPHFSLT